MSIKEDDPAFWEKVRVAPNGCWLWRGSVTPRGYPTIRRARYGGGISAYRYAQYLRTGTWPSVSTEITCGDKLCINDQHRVSHPTPPPRQRKPRARGRTRGAGPPLEAKPPERALRILREMWELGG